MAFPPSLITRAVYGRFLAYPEGVPAKGSVAFKSTELLQGPADGAFVAPIDAKVPLDEGEFVVLLPATDDPDWTPAGWTYTVTVTVNGKTFKAPLELPVSGPAEVDLAAVLNLGAAPGPATFYIPAAAKGAPGGVAELGEDGTLLRSQLPDITAGSVDWDSVAGKPTSFPPIEHTHLWGEVAGLGAELSAKADAGSVSTSLAAKADLVGGVIPTSQIPAIATTEFLGTVASQSAMLALSGQAGDFAIRSDRGSTWVIAGATPSQLSSWVELPSPTAPVTSVNSQTGVIVLGKGDVGLGNADNTPDISKPISAATQSALNAKADAATLANYATSSSVTSGLSGKADSNHTHAAAQVTGLSAVATSGSYNDLSDKPSGLSSPSVFTPADHGLLAWNFDPIMTTGGVVAVGGTLYVMRIQLASPATISNILMYVTAAGATLTANQCWAGLYDSAGNLLSATAQQATNWQTTGLKTMALAAPQSVPAGTCYVGVYGTGTTLPQFTRGSNVVAAALNANLTSPAYRWATANTGLTTALPSTLGSRAQTSNSYWVALS
ncbi:hypothetical protein FHR83_007114 [Actinoplanes campanulatus]|uniref:Minor tail protein n=1 Tax=Actinoplanes campanulatus TaxID=113559 RepID=A0A7W5AN89_9ACTN|nr:hypothetical protein [Actinoplanes campanulatus]MBB3099408.1 hypothetical protein [Actinoplanes campanulatus]GGN40131.1 hypothetical protein GCM10010109_68780 [Actinoplanes campanulatus]GID42383.1 hypothetical protein Aca09nite_88890 [Actinoplanes campanulatus]